MTRSEREAAPRGERSGRLQDRFVRVLVSSRTLSLRDALALDRNAFERDWSGAPPPAAAGFTVALDPERLFFVAGAAQAPEFDASVPGTFAAGLWQRDVAELFIGAAGSPAYLELNLSPAGAWWSCAFAGYRQPAGRTPAPAPGVETLARIGATGWAAGLAVPRTAVLPGGEVGRRTTLNACMLVGGRDRRYLCWRPAAGEPDFHLPACFAPIEPVAI